MSEKTLICYLLQLHDASSVTTGRYVYGDLSVSTATDDRRTAGRPRELQRYHTESLANIVT